MTTLIPHPVRLQTGDNGGFRLDDDSVRVTGVDDLRDLAELFVEDLRHDTGIAIQAGPVASGEAPTVHLELVADEADLAGLPDTTGVSPSGGDPRAERYGLEISSTGARVWSTHVEGIRNGLSTLRQLAASTDGALPAVRILDAPRFAWRGLTLDVGRTFLAVEEVERIVDMLALYKLNVLHLHLTEDAGWRVEVPSRPALAEVGGAGALGDRPGGHYTTSDLSHLVAYALRRGVTVVPEIDVPGHATAALRAYPELTSTGEAPEAVVGAGIFASALHLDLPGTDRFLADVFADVVALTPGPFVHIGGDEAFGVSDEEFAPFIEHVVGLVRGLGKRIVGWQEIARADIGPDEVVQYWFDRADDFAAADLGSMPEGLQIPPELAAVLVEKFAKAGQDVVRAAERGAKVLMSPTKHTYLDVPYAEPSADPAQEESRGRIGLSSYPGATVRDVLDWDPERLLAGLADGAVIAGVEAALWGETVADAADAHFLLLPRLPGVAEKAWSPSDATAWDDYRDRLAAQGSIWQRRDWGYFRSSLVDWPEA
ncbi:family 20 glycosylhydrolase [Nocardioides panacihumi]|uniref:beta-N-acetylhexosaminidase n=1 Tax=Nocardioides panacihumi TaxID=400774 RepID=A0ABN2RKX8_9ACTN